MNMLAYKTAYKVMTPIAHLIPSSYATEVYEWASAKADQARAIEIIDRYGNSYDIDLYDMWSDFAGEVFRIQVWAQMNDQAREDYYTALYARLGIHR